MGNSIRTTSNTQTPINSTPATFNAGDAVLCPSLNSSPFTLIDDPYGNKMLAINHNGSYHYYDQQGYFVRASDTETDDCQPSLFYDTPANRQAIATLYSGNPNSTDNIVMPAVTLASIASEIDGAGQALHDVSILLHMIYQEKITPLQAIAMTRLSHDATNTWAELLYSSLEAVNQTLSSTRIGKAGK